jgi:3-oxoadipate enol-lactonase / 4-carboxymuconolactone decarboxylase
MTDLTITATQLHPGPHPNGSGADDVLVVGPSLGTAVEPLWAACAERLGTRYRVIGWDLPGHGRSRPASGPFEFADLARAVADLVRDVAPEGRRRYAGVSAAGAVALHLALDAPELFEAVAVVCSGARIGEPAGWHERAELVRRVGTPALVDQSARRWFAPGFVDRDPATAAALLSSLRDVDADSYARVCEALAVHDVRARLASVRIPVLAIAGAADFVTPPELAEEVAAGVPDGRAVVVDGAAHLAPAERPSAVADLLLSLADRSSR